MSPSSGPIDLDMSAEPPEVEGNPVAMKMFEAKLAHIAARETELVGRKNMWLAHHWPQDYGERCVTIAGRHVCRRCAALYPLGLLTAFLFAIKGFTFWPTELDPAPIWILSLPATIAYCAEALGVIKYNPKVQVATTIVAAFAFGHALGYEFQDRWSSEFWGPIAVFGGIWFFATVLGMERKKKLKRRQVLRAMSAMDAINDTDADSPA